MNCSDEMFPRFQDLTLFKAVLDNLVMSLIIFGNSFIIFAIARQRQREAAPNVNNPSTLLVLNLCIADLLVGVFRIIYFLPHYICKFALLLSQHRTVCILRFFLVITPHVASGYSLIAIAANRYLAVAHPFDYMDIINIRRTLVIIAAIWIWALSQSSILLLWNHWELGKPCEEEVVPLEYTIIFGPLEVCVVIGVAACLYWKIHCEALRIRRQTHQWCLLEKMNTKSARAMVTILGVYSISWLPYLTLIIMREYGLRIPTIALGLSASLVNINYLANPFMYACYNRSEGNAIRSALIAMKIKLLCYSKKNIHTQSIGTISGDLNSVRTK